MVVQSPPVGGSLGSSFGDSESELDSPSPNGDPSSSGGGLPRPDLYLPLLAASQVASRVGAAGGGAGGAGAGAPSPGVGALSELLLTIKELWKAKHSAADALRRELLPHMSAIVSRQPPADLVVMQSVLLDLSKVLLVLKPLSFLSVCPETNCWTSRRWFSRTPAGLPGPPRAGCRTAPRSLPSRSGPSVKV